MENDKKYSVKNWMFSRPQHSILAELIEDDLERLGIDAKFTFASSLGLMIWIYFKTIEDMLLYRWLGHFEIDNKVLIGMTEDTAKWIDEVIEVKHDD